MLHTRCVDSVSCWNINLFSTTCFVTANICWERRIFYRNKKHLKNVGPIRHNEPPHANSPDVASGTVARRLRIDVHNDDNDNDNENAWQRGPLWPHGMGPIMSINFHFKLWYQYHDTFREHGAWRPTICSNPWFCLVRTVDRFVKEGWLIRDQVIRSTCFVRLLVKAA